MDELILSYERMISTIISKLDYVSANVSHEELMQVGRVAIWEKASKYDPEKGMRSTFFYICIKRAIWDYLNDIKKHNHTSLDATFEPEADEDTLSKVEQKILLENLYEQFGDNTVYFIERYMQGNLIIDIAEAHNTSVKKVTYWSNKILNYTKEEHFEEES